jgi:hypothetical protein
MKEIADEFTLIRDIRRSLADLLESTNEARLPVSRIMKNLDALEDLIQEHAADQKGGVTRGRTRPRYSVERTPSGEVLTEGRPEGKSPPFRVAKEMFDKVVGVLAASDRPVRFEEISDSMSSGGATPSDFQIRVCLRCLLTYSPPLITRNRNAYKATDAPSFAPKAAEAWASMRR